MASGSGTNAQAIIDHFATSGLARVNLVLSNKSTAQVLERATRAGIPALSFNRSAFAKAGPVSNLLKQEQPDLIVLAGFLWKIPDYLIQQFPQKIINIHPSLLPKYGGKGMYGHHVHEAVIAQGEKESGISIHYVNEAYDEGAIIQQVSCPVQTEDTAADLAQRIQQLEHEHFPNIIEGLLH